MVEHLGSELCRFQLFLFFSSPHQGFPSALFPIKEPKLDHLRLRKSLSLPISCTLVVFVVVVEEREKERRYLMHVNNSLVVQCHEEGFIIVITSQRTQVARPRRSHARIPKTEGRKEGSATNYRIQQLYLHITLRTSVVER